MSSKRSGRKENRARLTLRKEVLRNLTSQEMDQVAGGTQLALNDPFTLLGYLGGDRAAGHCRASQ